jgi:hypothetical protein
MNDTSRTADRLCPQCSRPIPDVEGFQHWCDHCDWNVASPERLDEENFLARQYSRLGESRGRKVLGTLTQGPVEALHPRPTSARIAAFIIAAGVHLLSFGIVLSGLAYAAANFPSFWPMVLGAAGVAVGWLSFPWPSRLPQEKLPPERFSALYAFVNDIAGKLGGAPVRHVIVDETYNASYELVGWRREPLLRLGLPFWMALLPQERVALVAHEMAHGVNGDSARGFILGSALRSLDEWVGLFQGSPSPATGIEALAGSITRLLAFPLICLRGLLLHLLWQDKQRSEYLADYLAATVAGTDATTNLLVKSRLGEHLEAVLLRHAYSSSQSGSQMLALFRQRIEALPEREWERLRRASEAEGARLDATHPPTAYRKALLKSHPVSRPAVLASADQIDAIDAELRALEDRLGRRLIARFARD